MLHNMFYVFKYHVSKLYACMFMFKGLDVQLIWFLVASSCRSEGRGRYNYIFIVIIKNIFLSFASFTKIPHVQPHKNLCILFFYFHDWDVRGSVPMEYPFCYFFRFGHFCWEVIGPNKLTHIWWFWFWFSFHRPQVEIHWLYIYIFYFLLPS